MKFGISLSAPDGAGKSFPRMVQERLEMVRVARDSGYHLVTAGQHYLSKSRMVPQPVPMLARIAAESGNMLLNAGLFPFPLYNPVAVASEIATLDALSGGRVVLAVGIGYVQHEFDVFGIPRSQRVSRQVESLEVVKRLWTEDKVTFNGKHFRLQDVTLLEKPAQKPRPSIWLGTSSDKGIFRAAHLADGLDTASYVTLKQIERQATVYRQALREAGKVSGDLIVRRDVYFGPNRRLVEQKVLAALKATMQRYSQEGLEEAQLSSQLVSEEGAPPEEQPFLLGSPEEVVEQVQEYQERVRPTVMVLRFQVGGLSFEDTLKAIRLFGDKVIPAFRDAS